MCEGCKRNEGIEKDLSLPPPLNRCRLFMSLPISPRLSPSSSTSLLRPFYVPSASVLRLFSASLQLPLLCFIYVPQETGCPPPAATHLSGETHYPGARP